MRQIVIDTETTGLKPEQGHRIIEIGCVELINRRLTGEKYQVYLNPEREIEAEALSVHGITNEFLSDKPLFKEVANEFIKFISGAELIAHNASFDVGFINHEFKLSRLGLAKLSKYCQVFDTLKLARKMHPGQRNSLDALSKRYQVEHINRVLHGALLDAEILAHVYLAMTGGQATLFGEDEKQARHIMSAEAVVQQDRKPMRIIEPNEEERAAHQKILAALQPMSEGEITW